MTSYKTLPDLLVFSHLRWDFVFQRPQHLLTRCAHHRRVYFIEEPIFEPGAKPTLIITARGERLFVVVPRLAAGTPERDIPAKLKLLVEQLVREQLTSRYICWYYTPMALKFTRSLTPISVVYDCMDELSNFKSASPELRPLEDELFRLADVVFTGGVSLYEHKADLHTNIHPFPSSVDVAHFRAARTWRSEPEDQSAIPHPRIGFAGVIDERFDIDLVKGVAQARPDWHFVLIGPVVKIDPESLPRLPNIHYLGARDYNDLPAYLSGWDIGILPFARNSATRFISPTKTPEYLAAGRRVVSTSIRDVVRTYGETGFARIADEPVACVGAIEQLLSERGHSAEWLKRVDAMLSRMSWDHTFGAMWELVESAIEHRSARRALRMPVRVSSSSPIQASTAMPAAPTA